MSKFYERYQQGSYQEVYDELVALGENVFAPTLFKEARLVAKTLMQRVRYNLDLLLPRLHTLDYHFGEGMWNPEDDISPDERAMIENDIPVFRIPTAETLVCVKKLEQVVGTLPLSLNSWYEEVGCVNIVGFFPSRSDRTFNRQIGSHIDPLLIYSAEFVLKMILEYDRMGVWKKDPTVPLAPDNLFKYGYSGSGPYAIQLPHKAFDAPLLRERHHTTFINYLRICLRWGGFPGLEQESWLSKEELIFLTKDFLPF